MSPRRFLLLDQNIRDGSGHFLELALVILTAAEAQGFEPWLVTNVSFSGGECINASWRVKPVLTHHKMQRWSLTPYGHSRVARDVVGRVTGKGLWNAFQRVVDHLHEDRPETMLDQFGNELVAILSEFRPTPNDVLLFATCDDFCALAVAAGFRRAKLEHSITIHILTHVNVSDQRECEWGTSGSRNTEFSKQIATTLAAFHPHRPFFWATTEELARQLNWAAGVNLWSAVDYPVRNFVSNESVYGPEIGRTLVLGGGIRSEKGLGRISSVISDIWEHHLEAGKWQIIIQAKKNLHAKIVPKRLRHNLTEWQDLGEAAPVRLLDGHLHSGAYGELIRNAGAGLFLYSGRRYYTRCSGVLVEMLSSAVPVIVPAASWLSRQIVVSKELHLETVAKSFNSILFSLNHVMVLPIKDGEHLGFEFRVDELLQLLLEVRHTDARQFDYLAVELTGLSSRGKQVFKERRILEGSPSGVTRSLFALKNDPVNVILRMWSPFRQRRITLHAVTAFGSSPLVGKTAMGGIGLVESEPNGVSLALEELSCHYLHYRATANQHATVWENMHSGSSFVHKLLDRASESTKTCDSYSS